MPHSTSDDIADDSLVRLFDPSDYQATGATFCDWLREDIPAWSEFEYQWVAESCFGEQIVVTQTSPIHDGTAVYLVGPDVCGPESGDPNWPENLLYLGNSLQDWHARVEAFGDEHSIAPADIDQRIERADDYRKIYRELNPGLTWG